MKTPMDLFLKVISEAGFQGVELRRDETFTYLKNHSIKDLKDQIEKNHLKIVSWNAIELFSLCNEHEFNKMKQYTERLMQIGNEIGCDMIIAVPSFIENAIVPKEKYFETTVSRLHQLRVLADNYQFNLGFEPLGFVNNSVRDIQLALQILDAVDVDGLAPSGLVIDTFHYILGENKLDAIAQIPQDRLWLIHIDDCIQKPFHTLQDSDRVWPGEGIFDLKNFIAEVKKIGYSNYISVELFNPLYWSLDPKKMAKRAYDSLTPFL